MDDKNRESPLGLVDVLQALRQELELAAVRVKESGRSPLLSLVGADVELAFTVEKRTAGKGGLEFKVLGIGLSGGGEKGTTASVAHRITVNLKPADLGMAGGTPIGIYPATVPKIKGGIEIPGGGKGPFWVVEPPKIRIVDDLILKNLAVGPGTIVGGALDSTSEE